jgi:hypothetical protein
MSSTPLRRVVPALIALTGLSGCAVGPDYRGPPGGPGERGAWLTPVDTGEVDEAW